jgi:hypothetical protein
MEPYIFLIETVVHLNFCFPVAFDTPTHTQVFHLHNAVHLFHRAVTLLTLTFACIDMLCMAEPYMIR